MCGQLPTFAEKADCWEHSTASQNEDPRQGDRRFRFDSERACSHGFARLLWFRPPLWALDVRLPTIHKALEFADSPSVGDPSEQGTHSCSQHETSEPTPLIHTNTLRNPSVLREGNLELGCAGNVTKSEQSVEVRLTHSQGTETSDGNPVCQGCQSGS
jgi:hypothetical protein